MENNPIPKNLYPVTHEEAIAAMVIEGELLADIEYNDRKRLYKWNGYAIVDANTDKYYPAESINEFPVFFSRRKRSKHKSIMLEAVEFAVLKHGKDTRKGKDTPYIYHPLQVFQILKDNNCSENVLIAGLLHDTLEDTQAKPDEILNMFGQEVLDIVQQESEDKKKSWKERKQTTIDHLENASLEVKLVCCADKLANLREMYIDQYLFKGFWNRFNADKEDIEWYYRSIAEKLSVLSEYAMYKELVSLPDKVFVSKEIKETVKLKQTRFYKDIHGIRFFENGFPLEEQADNYVNKNKEINIDELDYESDGMIKYFKEGKGYGFLDLDMNIVIEAKYAYARDFSDGYALVSNEEADDEEDYYNQDPNICFFIDKQGNEYHFEKEYTAYGDHSEGLFPVSDITAAGLNKKANIDHEFYERDYKIRPGYWGYADITGKEVIKPQYVLANEFNNGYAIVCKGNYVSDNKTYYNEKRKSLHIYPTIYYRENVLWGVIDKAGKEVIPCNYKNIMHLFSEVENGKYDNMFIAQENTKEGKWGIIDLNGNWIFPPTFNSIGNYINTNEFITFSIEGLFYEDLGRPMGLYSLKENRIILEPIYDNIRFQLDGTIMTNEIIDDDHNTIERIFDKTGNELFKSDFSELTVLSEGENYRDTWSWNYIGFNFAIKYEPMWFITEKFKRGNPPILKGLLDKNGNVILPCIYDVDDIFALRRLFEYTENDKKGIKTFEGEIIIPPIFANISEHNNQLFEVQYDGKPCTRSGKYGLMSYTGEILLSVEYDSISIQEEIVIAENKEGTTIYRIENFRL